MINKSISSSFSALLRASDPLIPHIQMPGIQESALAIRKTCMYFLLLSAILFLYLSTRNDFPFLWRKRSVFSTRKVRSFFRGDIANRSTSSTGSGYENNSPYTIARATEYGTRIICVEEESASLLRGIPVQNLRHTLR